MPAFASAPVPRRSTACNRSVAPGLTWKALLMTDSTLPPVATRTEKMAVSMTSMAAVVDRDRSVSSSTGQEVAITQL